MQWHTWARHTCGGLNQGHRSWQEGSGLQAQLLTRWLAGAGVAAVAALAATWWLSEPAAEPPSAQALAEQRLADASAQSQRPMSPFAAMVDAAPPGASAAAEPAAAPPAEVGNATPRGMTPKQWEDLQLALKDHPQRDAELRRVADYLAFKDSFDLFQAARTQHNGSAELQALARKLDGDLETRMANAEMTAAEAVAIKTTLLDQLEPDAARRAAQLDQWVRQHAGTTTPVGHDTQREAQYKQQEAVILAAWQALPPEQRNPRQLESQLDALRQRVFGP